MKTMGKCQSGGRLGGACWPDVFGFDVGGSAETCLVRMPASFDFNGDGSADRAAFASDSQPFGSPDKIQSADLNGDACADIVELVDASPPPSSHRARLPSTRRVPVLTWWFLRAQRRQEHWPSAVVQVGCDRQELHTWSFAESNTKGIVGTNEKADQFGSAVAIGRGLTGANSYDVIVGTPYENVGSGSMPLRSRSRTYRRRFTAPTPSQPPMVRGR